MNKDKYIAQLEEENLELVQEAQKWKEEVDEQRDYFTKREKSITETANDCYEELKEVEGKIHDLKKEIDEKDYAINKAMDGLDKAMFKHSNTAKQQDNMIQAQLKKKEYESAIATDPMEEQMKDILEGFKLDEIFKDDDADDYADVDEKEYYNDDKAPF